MDYNQTVTNYIGSINEALNHVLIAYDKDLSVSKAMEYSLLAGGKRLRPMLLLEFYRIHSGKDMKNAMPFACALEMIHTYSLIHDDLPCMDNDELRRGKPTNHMIYGEAMAMLAGDGLLTAAFEVMLCEESRQFFKPHAVLDAAFEIARGAGALGMVGGQCIDIESEDKILDIAKLSRLNNMKTGALIKAACRAGCFLAEAGMEELEKATEFAESIGLAFQIKDDILDIYGEQAVLGKKIGNDRQNKKSTYPVLIGVEACQNMVNELTLKAKNALSPNQDTEFLKIFADYLAEREK